jgi:hypothetical protein
MKTQKEAKHFENDEGVCYTCVDIGRKEALEQAINLFKKDSIYTGAVIEFEIRSNLGAEEEETS